MVEVNCICTLPHFGEYVMVLIDLFGSNTMFFKYYYVIILFNLSSLHIKLELHLSSHMAYVFKSHDRIEGVPSWCKVCV